MLPGSLAQTFLAHLKEPGRWPSPDTLEEDLLALHRRGREAWPAWSVPAEDLARHIASRWQPDVVLPLQRVAAEDLYLVLAFARGEAGAAARLGEQVRDWSGAALRRREGAALDEALLADLLQQLLEKLLTGKEGKPPQILKYAGRGPLAGWVQTAARNLHTDAHRQEAQEDRLRAEVREGPMRPAQAAQEMERDLLVKQRRDPVRQVLRAAYRLLDERQRALLKLRFREGESGPQIAARYKVDKATANRWLVKAEADFRANLAAQAREQLDLSPSELASLIQSMGSRIEASFLSALHWEGAGHDGEE